MAKFLFTAWPFSGHLHPNIAIAHALKSRGHDVAFYSGKTAASKIRNEGFGYYPFRKVDEEAVERVVFSQQHVPSLFRQPFRMIAVLREWLLDTVPDQVKDLENLLSRWHPHAVVCDPTFWGPILVLHERDKIPVAISSFMPGCMVPGPDAPPWGLGLPLPRTWRARLLARLIGASTDLFLINFRRRVNRLRLHYNLPAISDSVNAHTGRMPLHLIPSVPALDYNRGDLPSSVHYIGSCVWNKSRNEPPPEWLDRIPKEQPLVHVTEGTMHAQTPFVLRAAAVGLTDLPMQVIMTTGANRNPKKLDFGLIGANVRVEQWVAHSDLLPITDVMVTTGGGSTVLAGLEAGVPMVIVPTQWDKPDNAQRVVEAGAGLRLSPHRCTPKRLRSVVEHVLNDASFRNNAKKLAVSFKHYGGPSKAAELLNNLCNEAT